MTLSSLPPEFPEKIFQATPARGRITSVGVWRRFWHPGRIHGLDHRPAIRAAARPFATGLEDVYLDATMLRSILEPGYRAILPRSLTNQ